MLTRSPRRPLISGDPETFRLVFVMILFMVLGSFPVYLSYGDFFFANGFIQSADKNSDKPELSLFMTISLFVRSLSFIVRINFSILSFPLWSLIGHSTCSMYFFLQKSLNLLLRKIVLIFGGNPCRAIYFFKNSITFSVFGFRKNFASGHAVNGRLILISTFSPLLRLEGSCEIYCYFLVRFCTFW